MYNLLSRLLPCLALLLLAMPVKGDSLTAVDSLLNLYNQSKGDARLSYGRQLLDIYAEGAVFFNDPPTLSGDESSELTDLKVWFGTERYYITNSYFAEAIGYIGKALPLAKQHDADMEATMLCDHSYCLFKTSDYTKAIEAGQKAIEKCQQTKNLMQLSRAYLYISLVNHALRNYDEAMALVDKSIQTNKQLGPNMQTHNALGIACEIYCSAMEIDKAIAYGQEAVEAARAIGYMPGVANHLSQLSYAYDRKGDYQRGLEAADEAIAIITKSEPLDRNQLAICLEYKSWNLIDIGRQREAADVLRQAIKLEEEVGNTHAVWYDYRTLSEALEAFDPHGSIEALKRYTRMGDSIHSQQLKDLMSQANAEFHNDELKEENEEKSRLNRIIVIASLVVVLLLVVTVVSLWFAFRQKKRSNDFLQKLSQARENFFTNVTHEFRTPLTVILGYGKRLKDNPAATPQEVQMSGEMIEREGQQLLQLVGELLDLAKLQASSTLTQENCQWRTGNIVAYLNMLIEPFYTYAEQQDIELSYTPRENEVSMDFVPNYVQRALNNLVSNALKFTPAGGRVNISTRSEKDRLVVEVADTGCGLDEESMKHIFEPFYQADNAQTGGTGIGLTLTRQIVISCGGTIGVASTKGRGTTFTISVPLKQNLATRRHMNSTDMQSTPAAAQQQMPTLPMPTDESSRQRILVVEDNRDVAYLIGSQLADLIYSITYASNGRQGIEKAQQQVPDLIITDLMMPQMDGLEMVRQLRSNELTNHIPIIVITARSTHDDLKEGLVAGADAYLNKPFDADELRIRIEKLLQQRQLLRDKFTQMSLTNDASKGDVLGQLSPVDKKFIGRLNDLVYALMGRQQIDVESVASNLKMTPSQLRRKLVAITGQTPAAYIMQIRLSNAQRLLDKHPEMSISDVAYRCGFSDQAHFSHAFQKAYGISPSQWVKRAK